MKEICSICETVKDNDKLFKCNNCPNLFHQSCIKKWLRINTDSDTIYYCTKCSFVGFNDKDLSYQPCISNDRVKYCEDERCCCKIC